MLLESFQGAVFLPAHFHTSPEVGEAIAQNQPVVALESTVISHGLPYPQNLETARAMERAVRDHGATPATIALWPGQVKIGLEAAELEKFAAQDGIRKLSSRDLAPALLEGVYGSTTVAATMVCAHKMGIRFFATGGIGGVHRDVEQSWDISADLKELERTPVAVICSGAKAILDMPKTLEYLETLGVPVVGYGSHNFPSFYAQESGLSLESAAMGPEEAATLVRLKWSIEDNGGILFTNPVPAKAALDREWVEQTVELALKAAKKNSITGKEVTPFLLKKMTALSDGATLEANRALLIDNARVAAQIATAYFKKT
jgi:pseudouridine-5'-phosphate glycosidase